MLTRLFLNVTGAGFSAAIATADTAHRALSLLPPYKRASAVVLDSLFGPAEPFEYVSTTAPTVPPPTIS